MGFITIDEYYPVEFYNETKDSKLAWIKAEVWYAVKYEMAMKPTDFFIRRTGLLFFDIHYLA